MPGGSLLVDSSGRLGVSSGGNLIVGGGGDACTNCGCAAGCTNVCFTPWRFTYSCSGTSWSSGTSLTQVCDNSATGTSNAKVGTFELLSACTYQTYTKSTNCCDVHGCTNSAGSAPTPGITPTCGCGTASATCSAPGIGAVRGCSACGSHKTVSVSNSRDGGGGHCIGNTADGTYDCTNTAGCCWWNYNDGTAHAQVYCLGQGLEGDCNTDPGGPTFNSTGTIVKVSKNFFNAGFASPHASSCGGCPASGPYYNDAFPCPIDCTADVSVA